ncbi:hypothetical protein C7M61_001580 [Candidozyma pseudohaemuli]|uniref:RRM domain-containing protein n=1 Tax=Candidozyma pseudohaemuli TaxID=418784 RepID=A0A2P7YUY9_9ASCO|nr:hypothetical protein C7M61_001580 [[Candida] pseudohaemulonii]PSK39775.1 hypothetical protein C7M61_001580 [[Candida] pseudohaemulonii]
MLIHQDRSRSPVRNRDRSPGTNSRKDYEAPRGLDKRGGYARRQRDRGSERSFKDRIGRRDGGGRDRGRRGDRRDRGERPPKRGHISPEDASTVPGNEDERSLVERNYDRSIFIGNIPFEATAREVNEIFNKDFEVVRADIVTRRGLSRGMATVEFSTVEDVERAIEKFDRTQYQNREIFVRQDYPPPEDKRERSESSRSAAPPVDEDREPNPEVFVGNLPYTTSWQTLKDEFRSVGTIVRADVLTDRQGKSRGYGTVVFKTTEDAQAAIDKYNGFDFEGRNIDVRFAREAKKPTQSSGKKNSPFTEGVIGDGERSRIIFVANLPYITTKADLYDLFETVGQVTNGEIQLESRGRPSGNAVVEFENEDLADQAIQNLDGYNYGGRPLQISFAQYPSGNESNDAEMAD